MSLDPIRGMAFLINVPLVGYWPKLAAKLGLGPWGELLSAPVAVLATVGTLELIARSVEGRWTGFGVPLPVGGFEAFKAANVLRTGRSYERV